VSSSDVQHASLLGGRKLSEFASPWLAGHAGHTLWHAPCDTPIEETELRREVTRVPALNRS